MAGGEEIQLNPSILILHIVSHQDVGQFQKLLRDLTSKYEVVTQIISTTPVLINSHGGAANMVIIPSAFLEIEFNDAEEARLFRIGQSLIK